MDTTAVYLEVSAEVRYWEDATINGVEDTQGALIPFRDGDLWRPVIDLETGRVLDWPDGVVADIYYKICDAGEYWLLNAQRERIAKWGGFYVPGAFLCHGDTGYGDYIILVVDAQGIIQNYQRPDVQTTHNPDDQTRWLVLAECPENHKTPMSTSNQPIGTFGTQAASDLAVSTLEPVEEKIFRLREAGVTVHIPDSDQQSMLKDPGGATSRILDVIERATEPQNFWRVHVDFGGGSLFDGELSKGEQK